ncbi:MAG: beta-lactamase family protein, partial [Planctomycetes bacterium]|nr:beta-lactamase family protein [Planctomycetota bacterium]
MKPRNANLAARPTIALLTLLLFAPAGSFAADEPASVQTDYHNAVERLSGVVQEELDRGIISGVSIALVDGERVALAAGFGLADKAREVPATATTVYRVGSISKLFTALAAMQLVEQGRFELDVPITRYLPDFRIEIPFEHAEPPTLRQLMCHRSGMVREAPVGGYLDDSQPGIDATVASLQSCALVNPPNTKTR